MDLMPILSTLRRHKTAASLIVLEIALTSTIVCNALHLIGKRIALLTQDSGLPEAELVVLPVRGTGGTADPDELTLRDLQVLRALPGVKSATVVNQVIYGHSSNNSGIALEPGTDARRIEVSHYSVGEDALKTMGLQLVQGRDFRPEEYLAGSVVDRQDRPSVGQVILSRSTAERLWPGQPALGRVIYVYNDTPSTVVGVVERLMHPYPAHPRTKEGDAVMFPVRPSYRGGSYLLRVEAAQRDAVLRAAIAAVERNDATRIVDNARPLTEMRAEHYAQHRAMAWLLGGVCGALLVVTAFGIVGLASFWVQQRTRMIGTRRALGATRGQILRYFQAENFLLASAGIALGMLGALGLSLLLMQHYEVPRLPLAYLPAGAVVLWALGQLAVWAPARRAAALPPVAALRS